jgi:hypothetical protein
MCSAILLLSWRIRVQCSVFSTLIHNKYVLLGNFRFPSLSLSLFSLLESPVCDCRNLSNNSPQGNQLCGYTYRTSCVQLSMRFMYYSVICREGRRGTRWRSWLRHCATNRKAPGSISDVVSVLFNWHNPYSRTVALGFNQTLTEMSTRNLLL